MEVVHACIAYRDNHVMGILNEDEIIYSKSSNYLEKDNDKAKALIKILRVLQVRNFNGVLKVQLTGKNFEKWMRGTVIPKETSIRADILQEVYFLLNSSIFEVEYVQKGRIVVDNVKIKEEKGGNLVELFNSLEEEVDE